MTKPPAIKPKTYRTESSAYLASQLLDSVEQLAGAEATEVEVGTSAAVAEIMKKLGHRVSGKKVSAAAKLQGAWPRSSLYRAWAQLAKSGAISVERTVKLRIDRAKLEKLAGDRE